MREGGRGWAGVRVPQPSCAQGLASLATGSCELRKSLRRSRAWGRNRSEARESVVRRPGRLREGGRGWEGVRVPQASCAQGLTSLATGGLRKSLRGSLGRSRGWGGWGQIVAKLVRAWFGGRGDCAKAGGGAKAFECRSRRVPKDSRPWRRGPTSYEKVSGEAGHAGGIVAKLVRAWSEGQGGGGSVIGLSGGGDGIDPRRRLPSAGRRLGGSGVRALVAFDDLHLDHVLSVVPPRTARGRGPRGRSMRSARGTLR